MRIDEGKEGVIVMLDAIFSNVLLLNLSLTPFPARFYFFLLFLPVFFVLFTSYSVF